MQVSPSKMKVYRRWFWIACLLAGFLQSGCMVPEKKENEIDELVKECWRETPEHFRDLKLDACVAISIKEIEQ